MNYDSFNVHDLVCEALALQERAQLMGDREPFTDAMLAEIESFIRKAAIREASVGVGTVRRAGDSPLPEAPLMFVPWETKDGDYDLIPKETT